MIEQSNTANSKLEDKLTNPSCCVCFDSSYNRFIALILILFYCFAIYFCVDIPGSLQSEIQDHFNIDASQFEYLYSVSILPNAVLSVLGGILTDRIFGLHKSALIFGSTALVGQSIGVLGAFMNTYWIMVFGRFIYGIGNSTIEIMTCAYIVLWFRGKELSLVFGLSHSVAKLGTSAVFFTSSVLHPFTIENLPKNNQIGVCILPGVILFVAVIACIYLLSYLSRKTGNNLAVKAKDKGKVRLNDIISFTVSMWLITIILTNIITVVLIFNSMAQRLLCDKFGLNKGDSNIHVSLFNTTVAAISPFSGYVVDKLGREIYFNIMGHVLSIIALIVFITTNSHPSIFLFFLAGSFSILSSCTWPLISQVVDDYQVGTAYGVVFSAIGLSFTVSSVFAGYLLDYHGHDAVIYLFLALYLVSGLSVLILWFWDSADGGGTLNMSQGQRIQLNSRVNIETTKSAEEAKEVDSNIDELHQISRGVTISTLGSIYSCGT